jgi:hypothetical protein
MDGIAAHTVPPQQHRAAEHGLAGDRHGRLLGDEGRRKCREAARRHDDGGIDEDAADVAVQDVIEAEHQQARKSGDGDPDLVGHLQPPASLPTLLRHKNELLEPAAFLLVEMPPVGHVALERGRPGLREGMLQDLPAVMFLQPAEHGVPPLRG